MKVVLIVIKETTEVEKDANVDVVEDIIMIVALMVEEDSHKSTNQIVIERSPQRGRGQGLIAK